MITREDIQAAATRIAPHVRRTPILRLPGAALGITCRFVQDNHSLSVPAWTLRGLHFQSPPRGQDKLVRCIRGRIFDVAVDVRKGSPTYGRWVGAELSAENGDQLFIPVERFGGRWIRAFE